MFSKSAENMGIHTCKVMVISSNIFLQVKNEAPTVGAICWVNVFSTYLVIVEVLPTPVNMKI